MSRWILVVEDEPALGEMLCDNLQTDGYGTELVRSGTAARDRINKGGLDLIILDIMLPGIDGFEVLEHMRNQGDNTPVLILSARIDDADRIRGLELRADDYLTKPFDLDEVRSMARRVMERQSLHRQLGDLRERARAEYEPGVEIIGQSRSMQEIYKIIGRVAASPATVLIQGESGTGKEMIARAVHAYSDRWDSPFVAINCSAIPTELLESDGRTDAQP